MLQQSFDNSLLDVVKRIVRKFPISQDDKDELTAEVAYLACKYQMDKPWYLRKVAENCWISRKRKERIHNTFTNQERVLLEDYRECHINENEILNKIVIEEFLSKLAFDDRKFIRELLEHDMNTAALARTKGMNRTKVWKEYKRILNTV